MQAMSTMPTQVPPEIANMATLYQLGQLQKFYEPTKPSTLYHATGLSAIVMGCLIIIFFFMTYATLIGWLLAWQVVLIPLVGLTWFLFGVVIIFSPYSFARMQVYVCSEGMICCQKTTDVVRWNQIERLWQSNHVDRKGQNDCLYTIRRNDETFFTFTSELQDVEELAKRLEDEIMRYLFPRAIAAYQAGQPLAFDEIVVSRQDIRLRADRRSLPWNQFAKLTHDARTLTLYKKDEPQPWATLKTRDIPNIPILQAITDYVQDTRKQRTLPQLIAYKAGSTIHFGRLSLSWQGIEVDNGKERFAWQEIASIGVGENELIIRKEGKDAGWYTVPLWMLRDVVALKELLACIVWGRPQEFPYSPSGWLS